MKKSLIFAALLLTPALAGAETSAGPAFSPAPAATEPASPQPDPPARRARPLERFDTDQDGELSETERQASGARVNEKGTVLRDRVMEEFDADKDGQLSEVERAKAREARKSVSASDSTTLSA